MRYGLSATTVHNSADLQSIQSRVIATMLQKFTSGGLNINDMRTEIGIEQLKLIRDAIFSDSATGKLIMIN